MFERGRETPLRGSLWCLSSSSLHHSISHEVLVSNDLQVTICDVSVLNRGLCGDPENRA